MNSTIRLPRPLARRPRSARATPARADVPVLTWVHADRVHRVAIAPETSAVRFEVERPGGWDRFELDPSSATFTAAAVMLERAPAWPRFLELLAPDVRAFVAGFRRARLDALVVATRCPGLLADLADHPALLGFVARHAALRGHALPRWDELAAVHERSGLYGLLEWLGLPATRAALDILDDLSGTDIPRPLVEPLRDRLWAATRPTSPLSAWAAAA